MAHGGKRRNAGRKAGAVTVKTREIADTSAKEGLTPLEVMLANMRHYQQLAADAEQILAGMTAGELAGQVPGDEPMDEKAQFEILLAHVRKAADLRDRAQACARDAARFMHAPIAAVDPAKKGGEKDEFVPLVDRLKAYSREDAIKAAGTKVAVLPKRK